MQFFIDIAIKMLTRSDYDIYSDIFEELEGKKKRKIYLKCKNIKNFQFKNYK